MPHNTKNTPYKRVDRVNDLIRKIVSEVLLSEIHHKGMDSITVTAADISPDFKYARVYYRTFSQEHKDDARLALINVLPKISKKLAKELHTKYAPKLKFLYDNSLETGSRIEQLLDLVSSKNDDPEDSFES